MDTINFYDLDELQAKEHVDALSGYSDKENFEFKTFINQSALKDKHSFFSYYEKNKDKPIIYVLGHINTRDNDLSVENKQIKYRPLVFFGTPENCYLDLSNKPNGIKTLVTYMKNKPMLDSVYLFALQKSNSKKNYIPSFKTIEKWDLEWSFENYITILDANYNNIICKYKDFTNEARKINISLKEETNKLQNLIDKISFLKDEYDNKETEYNNKLIELEDADNELKKVELQIQNITEKIKIKESELDSITQKVNDKYKDRVSLIEKFCMLSINDIVSDSNKLNKNTYQDIHKTIEHIDKYLKNNLKLDYQNDTTQIINKFIGALLTNQIIILEGPPGTGKSSLTRAIAKAINAKYYIIPVQPNWIDKSDLFGFYNYKEETFVSTLFTDTLIEAIKNPNDLYIICLDEMNLAHVEYYLADILSAMEGVDDSDRIIELYPQSVFQSQCDKIATSMDPSHKNNTILNCKIPLPKNVQIVGTLNMDYTTKNLSPKVIDRSFIIKLDYERTQEEPTNASNVESIRYYPTCQEIEQNYKYFEPIKEIVNLLNEKSDTKYNFSNRTKKHITKILDFDDRCFLSNLVISKIMPRVYINLTEEAELTNILQKIKSMSSKYPDIDFDLLINFIETYSDSETGSFDYWR